MSIAAVAQEAGVVPSTIHKVYPDIAEEIRVLVGRNTRQQRDQHYAELVKARKTIKELRTELQELQGDLARLASVNLELDELNTRLNAELAGKVVSLGARR